MPLAAQPLPRVPEPAVSSVTDPAVPLAPAGGACDAGSSRWEAPRPSAPIARPRVRPPTWATTRADAHALYHRMCSGGRRPRRAGDGLRLYSHAQRRRLFLNFTDCVSDLCAGGILPEMNVFVKLFFVGVGSCSRAQGAAPAVRTVNTVCSRGVRRTETSANSGESTLWRVAVVCVSRYSNLYLR